MFNRYLKHTLVHPLHIFPNYANVKPKSTVSPTSLACMKKKIHLPFPFYRKGMKWWDKSFNNWYFHDFSSGRNPHDERNSWHDGESPKYPSCLWRFWSPSASIIALFGMGKVHRSIFTYGRCMFSDPMELQIQGKLSKSQESCTSPTHYLNYQSWQTCMINACSLWYLWFSQIIHDDWRPWWPATCNLTPCPPAWHSGHICLRRCLQSFLCSRQPNSLKVEVEMSEMVWDPCIKWSTHYIDDEACGCFQKIMVPPNHSF